MEVVYGINPVKVLLRQQKAGLEKVIIASGRGGSAIQEMIAAARQRKISVEFHPRPYLDELVGNKDHQGIALLRQAFTYSGMDELIANRSDSSGFDLILILDSIMDPQNLGAIIRTSYCLGANGVIIPVDRAAPVTAAVIKASAGSAEKLPVVRVTNLAQTIDDLKERKFWIFGADAHEGGDIREVDFECNVALVLGGEAKGIRPLIKKKCDCLLSIPFERSFDSLNVSVAAGIIGYEIFGRENRKKKE